MSDPKDKERIQEEHHQKLEMLIKWLVRKYSN